MTLINDHFICHIMQPREHHFTISEIFSFWSRNAYWQECTYTARWANRCGVSSSTKENAHQKATRGIGDTKKQDHKKPWRVTGTDCNNRCCFIVYSVPVWAPSFFRTKTDFFVQNAHAFKLHMRALLGKTKFYEWTHSFANECSCKIWLKGLLWAAEYCLSLAETTSIGRHKKFKNKYHIIICSVAVFLFAFCIEDLDTQEDRLAIFS